MKKMKLPTLLTRGYFNARAAALKLFLGNFPLNIKPKVFKTGSLGWHHSGKQQMPIGDCMVWCQVSIQVTLINSKELPPEGVVPSHETSAA